MLKGLQFCNNCGKSGHSYHTCRKPIISLGVILFRKTDKIEYLMICRKDSLGYVDFLRGKYPIYNKIYIQNLINEMTNEEKNKLITKDFNLLWQELWGDYSGIQYKSEQESSQQKFSMINEGLFFNNEKITLNDFIENSTTNWKSPEWGFPKGRRDYQENDINCAIREFVEETGINESNINIIQNVLPYEEVFLGSNFKSYKHKYFLAFLKNKNVHVNNFQKSEVSNMDWFTLDKGLDRIRDYNEEKKDVLKNIDFVLKEYSLIS